MRTISVFSIKGGVGKTTTAVNLASGLARADKRVLLIDLDPQGSVDLSLQVKPDYTIYDAMLDEQPLQQCIVNLGKNLDVIAAKDSLMQVEAILAQSIEGDHVLTERMKKLTGYDFIVIDLAPSLTLITKSALAFTQELVVPVSTDFLGIETLKKMEGIVNRINNEYSHKLKITKIVPTLYDKRSNICKDTLAELQNLYYEKVTYPIHYTAKIKEAPKFGKSIFAHAKGSKGAKDYERLVEDVIAMKIAPLIARK
ncbi:MAG: ParA family protein [Nanoarchaeota archaeon]|nr:ParA family protein [Nanoarchaeota archaeon]